MAKWTREQEIQFKIELSALGKKTSEISNLALTYLSPSNQQNGQDHIEKLRMKNIFTDIKALGEEAFSNVGTISTQDPQNRSYVQGNLKRKEISQSQETDQMKNRVHQEKKISEKESSDQNNIKSHAQNNLQDEQNSNMEIPNNFNKAQTDLKDQKEEEKVQSEQNQVEEEEEEKRPIVCNQNTRALSQNDNLMNSLEERQLHQQHAYVNDIARIENNQQVEEQVILSNVLNPKARFNMRNILQGRKYFYLGMEQGDAVVYTPSYEKIADLNLKQHKLLAILEREEDFLFVSTDHNEVFVFDLNRFSQQAYIKDGTPSNVEVFLDFRNREHRKRIYMADEKCNITKIKILPANKFIPQKPQNFRQFGKITSLLVDNVNERDILVGTSNGIHILKQKRKLNRWKKKLWLQEERYFKDEAITSIVPFHEGKQGQKYCVSFGQGNQSLIGIFDRDHPYDEPKRIINADGSYGLNLLWISSHLLLQTRTQILLVDLNTQEACAQKYFFSQENLGDLKSLGGTFSSNGNKLTVYTIDLNSSNPQSNQTYLSAIDFLL